MVPPGSLSRTMAGLPTNISEAVKRRNPNLFKTPQCVKEHPAPKTAFVTATALAVSTDEGKLNKTERQYLVFLRHLGFTWIGIQNVTLKLAHDCRYTPDFVVVDSAGYIQAREVKGFMRDDALVKLKVAARMFPFIEFIVVRKTKGGWNHTTVKP